MVRSDEAPARNAAGSVLSAHSFGELCRIGFALTWPVAAVGLLVAGVLLALLLRR